MAPKGFGTRWNRNSINIKESEISPTPTVRIPTKTQSYTIYIYTDDLVQTQVISKFVTSFFVSPYEPSLVESMGHANLVSLTTLAPTIILPLPWLHLVLVVGLCICPHQLLDDTSLRTVGLGIYEYSRKSLGFISFFFQSCLFLSWVFGMSHL